MQILNLNKIRIVFLLIAFVVCLAQLNPVSAQEARKNAFTPKCGMASLAGAEQCCVINFSSTFEKNTATAADVIPAGPVAQMFKQLLSLFIPIFDGNPVFYQLSQLKCADGVPVENGSSCTCSNKPEDRLGASLDTVCKKNIAVIAASQKDQKLKETMQKEYDACRKCAIDEKGYYSSIGCIPSDLGGFISNFVLRIGIGIAGFISLLCIIYSAFMLQISQGNPETVQKARDQITSCLIGLVMIIFSVFILRLIGVDILRIPGFA